MTPLESCPDGESTDLRKLRGIPVVRLILGLLSKSRSLFVGQSWIQCPGGNVRTHVSLMRHTRERRTFLSAPITHIAWWQRFLGLVAERLPAPRIIGPCPGFEINARGSNEKERKSGNSLDNVLQDKGPALTGNTNWDIFS